jgi:hypothetical protein
MNSAVESVRSMLILRDRRLVRVSLTSYDYQNIECDLANLMAATVLEDDDTTLTGAVLILEEIVGCIDVYSFKSRVDQLCVIYPRVGDKLVPLINPVLHARASAANNVSPKDIRKLIAKHLPNHYVLSG